MEYTVSMRITGEWRDIDAFLDHIASDDAQAPFEVEAFIGPDRSTP